MSVSVQTSFQQYVILMPSLTVQGKWYVTIFQAKVACWSLKLTYFFRSVMAIPNGVARANVRESIWIAYMAMGRSSGVVLHGCRMEKRVYLAGKSRLFSSGSDRYADGECIVQSEEKGTLHLNFSSNTISHIYRGATALGHTAKPVLWHRTNARIQLQEGRCKISDSFHTS